MLDIKLVKSKIDEISYEVQHIVGQGPRHTTCFIVTKNGSIATGESMCMDSEDFDQQIGEETAYNRAFDKLCELEAYHQRETRENVVGGI